MVWLVVDQSATSETAPQPGGDYGMWTGHRVPEDRAAWNPLVLQFYDYWRTIAPAGALPGRQHLVIEHIAPLWSRLFLLDVFREPLRYRYRLCGTKLVDSLGEEVTGRWLDEVHPQLVANPESRDRYRFVVETGGATWRRGPPLWTCDPDHRMLESCIVPLAADGRTVDKILAIVVVFDADGIPV